MKHVFIIGSVVSPSKGRFDYMDTRSTQTGKERMVETLLAINSVYLLYPNAKVYLVDGSLKESSVDLHLATIKNIWGYKDLECIRIENLNKDAAKVINTHHNKSHCEAVLYSTFLNHYSHKLKEYDFVTKLSGRYNLSDNCGSGLNDKDGVYFKRIWDYDNPYDTILAYPDMMLPGQTEYEMNWTASFCFSFGINRLNDFIEFWEYIKDNTQNTSKSTERIIRYWLWKNEIVSTDLDWKILAFRGDGGGIWHF